MKKALLFVPLAIGLVYFVAPDWSRRVPETAHIQEVTTATFDQYVGQVDGWVLADFWAPWCGPCRAMMPDLDALAAEFAGRVSFVKINIDESPELAERFRVNAIPQVYLFRDGGVIAGFNGRASRDDIRDWINQRVKVQG